MFVPRKEYPNPQFERENWENLNGKWEFEIDKSESGVERGLYKAKHLAGEITVPFCPESSLSGVGEKDFMNSVWYLREIEIKDLKNRVFLYIGACDYLTTVYVNAKEVGVHKGGYTPFAFDITDFVEVGKNTVIIHAHDDNRSGLQPRGKQASLYHSNGCDYTRTTGIWQTVWLEYVPKTYIKNVKYYTDVEAVSVNIHATVNGNETLCAVAYYKGKEVGRASCENCGPTAVLTINLSEKHLWEVGHGRLYDLVLTYGEDKVKSYFGLRSVAIEDYKFYLNKKSVFQRMVLDQGFYPDGIYTSPSDEDMIRDIQISLDAGFNGARLHEKVFEPRFLYHCDRMGYMVWGEYANWGLDHTQLHALPTFLKEWTEALERDFNHPSIIGWCPFNETWNINGCKQNDEVIETTYKMTKLLDPTRPCIDTSGNFHVVTDVFDIHEYRDAQVLGECLRKIEKEGVVVNELELNFPGRQKYRGEPVFVSEYGGIKWDVENDIESWGYGNAPKTVEEFINRYKGVTHAIMESPIVFGFCYTQLYDIEQEKNGLYTYDRKPKFDMTTIKEINTVIAKNEE